MGRSRMRAIWNHTIVAESEDTVVVEGNHYFPVSSLNRALISDSEKMTVCPWKGTAHYFHLTVNGEVNADAIWYYPEPREAAAEIRDRVAFWKGVRVE
jgi:uncharacterized protein (DUF427 family)